MGKKLQLDELGQLGQSGQNVSLPYFFFVLFEKIVKMNFIPENKVIENKYKQGFFSFIPTC